MSEDSLLFLNEQKCFVLIFDGNPFDWTACDMIRSHKSFQTEQYVKDTPREGTAAVESGQSTMVLTLTETLECVMQLLLVSATGWMNHRLIFILADPYDCAVLFHGVYRDIKTDKILDESIKRIKTVAQHMDKPKDTLLSYALSQALCMVNSERRNFVGNIYKARILMIDVASTQSYTSQLSALISGGFASLKSGISIDVCSLGLDSAPVALKQLADMTGGIHLSFRETVNYLSVRERISLSNSLACGFSNFLLFHFSISAAVCSSRKKVADTVIENTSDTRTASNNWIDTADNVDEDEDDNFSSLVVPSIEDLQYASVCHCHRELVELALVCSCCLTVYCPKYQEPACQNCHVVFVEDENPTVSSSKTKSF